MNRIQDLRTLRANAKSGAVGSICRLAARLQEVGTHKALKEAAVWLEKAARTGDAWAQYSLGYAYQEGEGVRKDSRLARLWYARAARQRYDSAILNLGILYARLRPPTPANYRRAAELYRKAARLGNRNACYNLGYYYECGLGVPKDLSVSFRWYLKAAQAGDAEAQCHVGYSYHEGEGVRRDDSQAVFWYRKSAGHGFEPAAYNMGLCYLYGDGVTKDRRRALQWFQKAAALGSAAAAEKVQELTAAQRKTEGGQPAMKTAEIKGRNMGHQKTSATQPR